MQYIISYSGGKDSQACLLWAVQNYGARNCKAVFCDTGWEHPETYKHIFETTKLLDVELVTIKSKKYDGFVDMAIQKGRFPSVKARFCTSTLKTEPFIDWILSQSDHLTIIQGIRAQESASRAAMQKQCTYFKYYFEPYNEKGRTHNYRKKDVLLWAQKFNADILRPVFDWSGQQVIDFILKSGQNPNHLYKEGFKRVGCFPCILSSHSEVRSLIERYPTQFSKLQFLENKLQSSFFKIDFVPKRFQSGLCPRTGKSFSTSQDVKEYLLKKDPANNLFSTEPAFSCSSFYHLCE